jgi:adenosylmethionine-8-amino-7-oxononanoate aminotransferase
MSMEEFGDLCVRQLEERIEELGPENVACFVAEPLLASGGVIVPPPGYQRRTMEVCREHGVLYLSDEVVTGFGRLGHVFASEALFDIQPDIVTTAKGLTSGYVPLGAFLVSDRLYRQVLERTGKGQFFANGFTYSGHPVACAAGLAVIDIIERENVLEHVRRWGPYFRDAMDSLLDLDLVGDVRGSHFGVRGVFPIARPRCLAPRMAGCIGFSMLPRGRADGPADGTSGRALPARDRGQGGY